MDIFIHLGQLLFHFRQLAIINPRGRLEIALLLRNLKVSPQLISLLTKRLQVRGGILLILPLRLLRRKLVAKLRKLLLDL